MSTPTLRKASPSAADRILDVVAVLFIVSGALLFWIGRQALTDIAAGGSRLPAGTVWVARADHHTAQTTAGAWLIAAGVGAGVVAAARHRRRA